MDEPQPQRKLRLLFWIAVPLAFQSLTRFMPTFWLFDLLAELTTCWIVICALILGLSIWKRDYRALVISSCACVLFAMNVWGTLRPINVAPKGSERITITQANLLKLNGNTAAIVDTLLPENPDVLLLYEVMKSHEPALKPFKNLPFRARRPYRLGMDLVILSRFPIAEIAMNRPASAHWQIEVGGRTLDIFSTHPVIPEGPAGWADRNRILTAVASDAGQTNGPRIIVGDFNTTPFSEIFSTMEEASRTTDSARGRGLFTTWPALGPVCFIRLDHLLASRDIRVVDKHRGGHLGSDHRPVTTVIEF